MALSSDDAIRILLEVVNGSRPEIADSVEMANYRAELADDVARILSEGRVVDVPFEIPDQGQ